VKIRRGPAAVIPSVVLTETGGTLRHCSDALEWEGRRRSGKPEDLPDNDALETIEEIVRASRQ